MLQSVQPLKPLPGVLVELSVFTRSEALAAGLEPSGLRRRSIVCIGKSVHANADADPTSVQLASTVARGLLHDAWVSHTTAALVHKLWLPSGLDVTIPHVSRPRRAGRPRARGVKGHAANVTDDEIMLVDGVRTSTPARVWLELANMLSLDDLIILGDHLVRYPRPRFEGRSNPHATIADLGTLLERHPRVPGTRRAREALALIRVGADSPMETKSRLALVRAGLPEPELQIMLDPNDPYTASADLGYRKYRVAIQYDGGAHLTSEQQLRDNRRDSAFSLAGWRCIKANRHDAAQGFHSLIDHLRALLSDPAA